MSAQSAIVVVEVFDRELRSHGRFIVADEPISVALPNPGRYLVRGWLPDGGIVEAQVNATAGSGEPVSLCAVGSAIDGAETSVEAAHWAMPWHLEDDSWVPAGPLAPLGSECHRLTSQLDETGAPLAIQLGTADGPTYGVMTLVGTPLRVMERADRRQAPAAPNAGLASALLAYLSAGDVRSAETIAAQMLADKPKPGRDPLRDLAVGYYFLRADDKRFARWSAAVARRMPRSPDAQLLAAYRRLRSRRGSLRAAKRRLISTVNLGMPVVAAGLQLLADGLVGFDEAGRNDPEVSAALRTVRRYQRASVTGVLTTFVALDPNTPLPGARLPAGERWPAKSTSWRELEFWTEKGAARSRPLWRAALARGLANARAQVAPTTAVFAGAALLTADVGVGIVERGLGDIFFGPLAVLGVFIVGIAQPFGLGSRHDKNSRTMRRVVVELPDGATPVAELRRMRMLTSPFDEYERSIYGGRTSPTADGLSSPLLILPRLHLAGSDSAGQSHRRASVSSVDETAGLRVVLRQTTSNSALATASLAASSSAYEALLQIQAKTKATSSEYLMLLSADRNGGWRSDLRLPCNENWLELVIISIRAASSLGPQDTAIVHRSVSATDRRGRKAWRKLLDGRDAEDPIAAAIAASLQRRPRKARSKEGEHTGRRSDTGV